MEELNEAVLGQIVQTAQNVTLCKVFIMEETDPGKRERQLRELEEHEDEYYAEIDRRYFHNTRRSH